MLFINRLRSRMFHSGERTKESHPQSHPHQQRKEKQQEVTNHGISDDLEDHKIVVFVVKSEGAAKKIISDKASSIGIGTNKARVLPTLGEGV